MWGCTKGCWSRSPVVPHRCGFGPPAVARGGPQRRRGSGLGVMEELRPPPQPPTPISPCTKRSPGTEGGAERGSRQGQKQGQLLRAHRGWWCGGVQTQPAGGGMGGGGTRGRGTDGGADRAGSARGANCRGGCGRPRAAERREAASPATTAAPEDPSLPPSLLPPLRPGAGGARPIRRGPPVGPGPWGGRNARPRGRGSPRSSCCSAAASSPGRWQPPPTIASSEKRRGPAAGPGGAAATAAAIFGAPRSRAAPRPRPLSVSAAGPRPLMSPAANGRARRGERGRRGRGGKARLKGAMAGWGRRVGPGARGPWYVPCGAGRRGCNAARGAARGTAGERNAVCRSAGYGY